MPPADIALCAAARIVAFLHSSVGSVRASGDIALMTSTSVADAFNTGSDRCRLVTIPAGAVDSPLFVSLLPLS